MFVPVGPRLLRVRVMYDKWILTKLFPSGACVCHHDFVLFKVELLLSIAARVKQPDIAGQDDMEGLLISYQAISPVGEVAECRFFTRPSRSHLAPGINCSSD